MGEIKTTVPFGESSMPGVYAVGDISTMFRAVTVAMAQGGMCAAGLAASLGEEPRPEPDEVEDILSLISPVRTHAA